MADASHIRKCTLLFDLDGTIIASSKSVICSYQKLLKKYGLPVPEASALTWTLGPGLRKCLDKLLPSYDDFPLEKAVADFREIYEAFVHLDEPYEGMEALLLDLAQSQKLFVATAKPEFYAKKILSHLKLDHLFRGIYGSMLTGERSEKGELLQYMVTQENLNSQNTIMIGDRGSDCTAAALNGCFSIGVTYGYGSIDEIQQSKPTWIASSVKDLRNLLLE